MVQHAAIVLSYPHDGAMLEIGEPRRIVNRYLDLLFGRERKAAENKGRRPQCLRPQWRRLSSLITH